MTTAKREDREGWIAAGRWLTARMSWVLVALLAAFGVSVAPESASAQEYGPEDSTSVRISDKKDKDDDDEDEEEQKLELDVRLTNEFHSMNNLDLREYEDTADGTQFDSSDQAILESDDRSTFGYTSIATELEYEVLESTEFNFSGIYSGMWGSDQIGQSQQYQQENSQTNLRLQGMMMYIYDLSVEWEPIDNDTLEVSTSVGRQPFRIGGVEEDFFMEDVIDGVTVDIEHEDAGTLRLVPVDLFAANSRPDGSFAQFVNGNGTVQEFRGDTNIFRFGGVYEAPEIIDGFDARAFGFYADVGASSQAGDLGTGADVSNSGELANVSDNDYNWMAGARAGYTLETEDLEAGLTAEYARSGGIDRKATQLGMEDVYNQGNAWGAEATGDYDLGGVSLNAKLRYFHADGGEYGENGLQFNHGFVGFKGSEVGGLNLDRYAGFHPSAYLGNQGVTDLPQSTSHRSGTDTFHGELGAQLLDEKLGLEFGAWYLLDTSQTNFDQDRREEVAGDLPFGYTEADLQAQQRFGKPLGLELDGTVRYRPNDTVTFYSRGGIFLPGEFYETEISRTAGTALGSDDPANFWAVTGGAALSF